MSAKKNPRHADQGVSGAHQANKGTDLNPQINRANAEGLAVARKLITAGVPVFRARPALNASGQWDPTGGTGKSGYWIPKGWENAPAELSTLEGFRQGDALAAVMGVAVDVLDVDVQYDGDETRERLDLLGHWPEVLGVQRTPSGGTHELINRLRVGSRDKFAEGIDHKGGRDDGEGRGFIWIAPTLKFSKHTGEISAYTWEQEPDFSLISDTDDSGAVLASRIRAKLAKEQPVLEEIAATEYASMTPASRARIDGYLSSATGGVMAELEFSAAMEPGSTDSKGRGWEKIQADAAYRLASLAHASWNALTFTEARTMFEDAAPTDSSWTAANVREKFTAQARRATPAIMPMLKEPIELEGLAATEDDSFELAVQRRLTELLVLETAQRRMKASQAGQQVRPAVERLTAFLAVPDEETRYRIEGLWPMGGRGILAAQYKAGKSTMVGNVIRALVDGDDFLGTNAVKQAAKVVLIDNELDPRTLRAWLRDQGIGNTDAVEVVTLRGRTATFDLMDPRTRREWAEAIQGADVVILDCLRPVLDALGLDENKDAGRFLVAFDALLADAGAGEALIVHHMGHSGERSRGDSRLQDWPDVTWKLVREDPDRPGSATYFSAFGRDVNVSESRLEFDPFSRHLTLVGGNRKEAKSISRVPDVLAYLKTNPGSSKTVMRRDLDGDSTAIGNAIDQACQRGLVRHEPRQGRGGGNVYFSV